MNSSHDTSSRAAPDNASASGTPAPRAAAPVPGVSLNRRRASELDDIFADNGLLARQIDGYRPRASQIEMGARGCRGDGGVGPRDARARDVRDAEAPGAAPAADRR
ncbi:hypothetical protein OKW46_004997 [Paraburkholderia sp. WSM4179]|nr:hypothetical protein [Paraburkholderia sp. WSM4179]